MNLFLDTLAETRAPIRIFGGAAPVERVPDVAPEVVWFAVVLGTAFAAIGIYFMAARVRRWLPRTTPGERVLGRVGRTIGIRRGEVAALRLAARAAGMADPVALLFSEHAFGRVVGRAWESLGPAHRHRIEAVAARRGWSAPVRRSVPAIRGADRAAPNASVTARETGSEDRRRRARGPEELGGSSRRLNARV